jgi:putative spermidine/putrescine transport system permease protein
MIAAASLWRALRLGLVAATVVFLIAPMLLVLAISFSSASFLTFPPPGWSLRWYESVFTDPAWSETLLNSVQVMVPTALLATALGTAAAIGLVRGDFPGKRAVTGVLMAPLVVPVIVIGAGIYEMFSHLGANGSFLGFVLAHTVIAVPFVISIVSAALNSVSEHYEKAALTLGATPWVAFRRVLLPLIAPSVLSGFLFAMVISFDELVISLFISTPDFKLVTVQMWSDVMGDVNPTIAAVGSLLFVASLLVLLLETLMRRAGQAPASPHS